MSLALVILFHIMIFAVATFGTSLLIERYYHGRLKWVLVPALTFMSGGVLIKTSFVPMVLFFLTSVFSLQGLGMILLGGVMTGVFFSFL
ncbi:MAG: hypothetical protein AMK74_02360 [Nitrospira bacterium SM23_35]|nr:MAG: hypothetical protein AMK74_02360 [Nitrospira bacterium SM23_35]